MEIENLKVDGNGISWVVGGESRLKLFDGYVFYADVVDAEEPRIFVILSRPTLERRDRFFLLDELGEVVKECFVPQNCPSISSLYAVEKYDAQYDVIVRSNDTSSGRDVGMVFDSGKQAFISWGERR